MSGNVRRKYSARSLAVGAVFCPACGRRLTERDSESCPACGFVGQDTMWMFPAAPPPLEVLSDHAELFTSRDKSLILKSIRGIQKGFPQIHWRITTANLPREADVGLFSFWLLNVSPLGSDEAMEARPWTVLLVLLANGDVAVAPGYAAEIWLSGHDWSRLLRDLHDGLQLRNRGKAVRNFLNKGAVFLENSWLVAKGRTKPHRNGRDRS